MACKHGMNETWCSLCNPPELKAKRIPRYKASTTIYGSSAVSAGDISYPGYVLFRTRYGKEYNSFENLDASTRMVHIDGFPYLWVIEKILDLAPNLKTIRVIPTFRRKLHESHFDLCRARGVSIIVGHHRPELAWGESRNISPFYERQASFLRHLQGEQKQLFDELVLFAFEEVEITARYFCLKGEEYVPQHVLAREYGFSSENEVVISKKVNAVLHYLDSTFQTGLRSEAVVRKIHRVVNRLRVGLKETQDIATFQEQFVQKTGIEKFPENFPLSRIDVFEEIINASKDGRLTGMHRTHPRWYDILYFRFGLDDGYYKTLEKVGQIMGGITRERVRQLEEKALAFLGIEEESSE